MNAVRPVTQQDAIGLLTLTVRLNRTRIIGSPFARDGYCLDAALSMVARATLLVVETHNGFDMLRADTPDGQHTWYLRREPNVNDPWNRRSQ